MTLYRLHVSEFDQGAELLANSDEHARLVAADRYAQLLHRSPDAYLNRATPDGWVRVADSSPIVPLHPPELEPDRSTRLGEHKPLVRVRVYDNHEDRLRLRELSESLSQVRRAIRQLARAQAAHRAEQAMELKLGFAQGRVPEELIDLDVERDDAMEFAIIAARRAVRARWYLTTKHDLNLPELRQADIVWALRDLLEHWHEWKMAERDNFLEDKPWLLTTSAGQRWQQAAGGGRPEGTMNATAAPPPGPSADPDGRIKSWNGIDLDQLSADLEALRDAIAVHEVAAFEWEAPDQAAARKLVGPTMWTLIHTFTTVRGRQARDGVVRWERAWLLAADRTLREQHWVINDEVVGPLPDDDR